MPEPFKGRPRPGGTMDAGMRALGIRLAQAGGPRRAARGDLDYVAQVAELARAAVLNFLCVRAAG